MECHRLPWQHLQVAGLKNSLRSCTARWGDRWQLSYRDVFYLSRTRSSVLIKTHFATCSNVSRLGCACRPCRENPMTYHPPVTFTESQRSSEPQDRSCEITWPEAGFPGRAFCRETQNNLPPCEVDKDSLVGILILAVVLIIKQCLWFSSFVCIAL